MKLLDWMFERRAKELTYDQIANLIDDKLGGSASGYAITAKTALQVSTVLACVRVIADGCATPRLHVYRDDSKKRRELAVNVPEYRLLARRPNEWQTSYEWRRMMTAHAVLCGAGLSIKVRGANRRVRELIPVEPGKWDVQKVGRYELQYRCWDEYGQIGTFGADDVFVLNNLQWEYHKSINAVALARSAIGLSIAAERSQEDFHSNALRPAGMYSVDKTLSPEQHSKLVKWIKEQSGKGKAGETLILDNAAKWQSLTMTGVDAQHVETRRLQIEEVCRIYGVFPIMIGHSDKTATFASSEAFFAAHLVHTLMPWHTAWTQRVDEMLLDGSGPLYAEFDTRYMRAGAMKDRSQWARTMTEMGIYTRNEIRDEEGKDPLPGLDEPLTPMNMAKPSDNQAPAKEGNDDETDPPDPEPAA